MAAALCEADFRHFLDDEGAECAAAITATAAAAVRRRRVTAFLVPASAFLALVAWRWRPAAEFNFKQRLSSAFSSHSRPLQS